MTTDEFYIKRCIQLSRNGIGAARPNPSVGAVIVHNNIIIGEGYTSSFGGSHAEVNAINSVTDKSLLKNSTIYVTLEPCSHFGKTPPCADLIVKHKFKRVVVGCLDPNPKVAGKGIEKLKAAGIEVVSGVLKQECRKELRRFLTNQEKKRPYIILKWAETKNGFIAPISKNSKVPFWISNVYSQQLVHKLRTKEHAILVGTNTVLADNPKLNVRSWFGNNPTRVILDRRLKVNDQFNVRDKSVKTIIFTEDANATSTENLIFEKIDFSNNLAVKICEVLYKHQIQSLIVEGGALTLQTFIDANLWDEAFVFVGDKSLETGIKSPVFETKIVSTRKIMKDTLNIYSND